jgi:hypothetical protein
MTTMPEFETARLADVAPCMSNSYFKGQNDKAIQAGTLDMRFSFIGDFGDAARELTARVQAAKDGGGWIFHHRPSDARTT